MAEHLDATNVDDMLSRASTTDALCAQSAFEDVVHAVNNALCAALGYIETSLDQLDQLPARASDDLRHTLQGALKALTRGGALMRDLRIPVDSFTTPSESST